MPYPYTFTDANGNTDNSYADVTSVQSYFMTYDIGADPDGGIQTTHQFLASCTADIDAVLLQAGLVVPPPAGAIILPILRECCAIGAAALIATARFESGDERIGAHAKALMATYDAQLGLLERQEVNGVLMGMQSAGWAYQANEVHYYGTGNTGTLSDGMTPKKANFTIDMPW